jgi:hypothetical protein
MTCSAILKSLLLLGLIAIAAASDDKTDRATLKGVTAVCTVVEAPDRLRKEDLQAAIEKKLTQAAITIDKSATTCLFLNVRALQALGRQVIGRKDKPIPLYAVDLRLELLQTVLLSRDKTTKAYAPTWSADNMATVSADELGKTVAEMTDGLVDRFVAAYKSANLR